MNESIDFIFLYFLKKKILMLHVEQEKRKIQRTSYTTSTSKVKTDNIEEKRQSTNVFFSDGKRRNMIERSNDVDKIICFCYSL